METQSNFPRSGKSRRWCWQTSPASLDTERAFQVVQTFAALIHENDRAGIMVTHDLRMCQYVDRVLQMQDGKLVKIYETKDEIMALARGEH
jgi:putative ABC transport system ATP-binding protein